MLTGTLKQLSLLHIVSLCFLTSNLCWNKVSFLFLEELQSTGCWGQLECVGCGMLFILLTLRKQQMGDYFIKSESMYGISQMLTTWSALLGHEEPIPVCPLFKILVHKCSFHQIAELLIHICLVLLMDKGDALLKRRKQQLRAFHIILSTFWCIYKHITEFAVTLFQVLWCML